MADLNGLVRYRNFRFLVLFEGDPNPVAGVNTVGALRPGQVGSGPITLEHGLTSSVQFEEWANEVWDLPNAAAQAGGREVSLEDSRKDITIGILNEAGQVVTAWNVLQCWVSEYTAVPELDGSANAIVIRSMTIQNEGWSWDASVTATVLDP